MFGTLTGISALLLGVFAMNLGFSLQATTLGLRAGLEGFPVTLTGFIMAMYYVGYVGGSVFAPKLVQKVGHIRVFSALASLASTSALLHAMFVLPVTWVMLRAMTGFCVAGLLVVAESWLNNASSNHQRGSVLSIYMVVALVASALGQLLLNVAPVSGFNLFILISVLVSISLVPIALSTQSVPPLEPTEPMNILRIFKISPTGVMSCFATGLLNGSFWGMGAVYALGIGLNTQSISIFMAMAVLGGIVSQWPAGRLSDVIDRRIVLVGLAIAVAISSLLLIFTGTPEPWTIYVLAALYGAATFPLYAISIAHVNDVIEAKDFVPASSALLMTYALGAALGPFIAGVAMHAVGAAGLFYFAAVVGVAMGAFTFSRLYVGARVRTRDKESFVAVPKTSAQAYEMAGQAAEEQAAEEQAAEELAAEDLASEDLASEDLATDEASEYAAQEGADTKLGDKSKLIDPDA
jgi:MFS family permease